MRKISVIANPSAGPARPLTDPGGVSAERRKFQTKEECGFLPKAATPVLQRFLCAFMLAMAQSHSFANTADNPPSENSNSTWLKSLWQSDTATGDWLGVRNQLNNHGIDFSPAYTGEVMDNISGGREPGPVYTHLLNLPLTIDLDKFTGWWDGGTIHANAFWIAGRSISGDKVGDIGGVSNIAAYRTVRLHELWFQQMFWDRRASLQFGLLAADSDFFTSYISALYLNGSFGAFPLVAANLPNPPIYPMAAPGARFWIQPLPHFYFQAGIYDGNTGAQDENKNGVAFRLNSGDGALIFSEIGWHAGWKLPGTYKLGSFVHTGNFPGWETGGGRGADFGIYGVLDQDLYRHGQKVISFFMRGGGTPAAVNEVDWYVDTGFNFTGFIPGRPDDVAGIALARSFISPEFSQAQVAAGSNPFHAETVLEATWKIRLNQWWDLQPDFQYIWTPGGETSARDAAVIGLRTTIAF